MLPTNTPKKSRKFIEQFKSESICLFSYWMALISLLCPTFGIFVLRKHSKDFVVSVYFIIRGILRMKNCSPHTKLLTSVKSRRFWEITETHSGRVVVSLFPKVRGWFEEFVQNLLVASILRSISSRNSHQLSALLNHYSVISSSRKNREISKKIMI